MATNDAAHGATVVRARDPRPRCGTGIAPGDRDATFFAIADAAGHDIGRNIDIEGVAAAITSAITSPYRSRTHDGADPDLRSNHRATRRHYIPSSGTAVR
ncbi:MAG: hypothetical protein AB7L94_23505, partial [Kofleriaceae bacterium]